MLFPFFVAHAAESVPADKSAYRGVVAIAGGAIDDGALGLSGAWAVTPKVHLIGDLAWTLGGNEMFARDDGDMVWHALAPGWRADVGLAWNMTGRGVQGIGPAIRVGGRPLTWEDGRAPGTAIEVFPELWARWVGHPGISLGVHAGMGVRPCCGEKPAGGALEGIFLAEAGWALPPGPSPAAMTATLTPEERLRRQRRNTAIGIAAGGLVVAGGVAAAFGLHDSLGHMDVSWSAY